MKNSLHFLSLLSLLVLPLAPHANGQTTESERRLPPLATVLLNLNIDTASKSVGIAHNDTTMARKGYDVSQIPEWAQKSAIVEICGLSVGIKNEKCLKVFNPIKPIYSIQVRKNARENEEDFIVYNLVEPGAIQMDLGVEIAKAIAAGISAETLKVRLTALVLISTKIHVEHDGDGIDVENYNPLAYRGNYHVTLKYEKQKPIDIDIFNESVFAAPAKTIVLVENGRRPVTGTLQLKYIPNDPKFDLQNTPAVFFTQRVRSLILGPNSKDTLRDLLAISVGHQVTAENPAWAELYNGLKKEKEDGIKSSIMSNESVKKLAKNSVISKIKKESLSTLISLYSVQKIQRLLEVREVMLLDQASELGNSRLSTVAQDTIRSYPQPGSDSVAAYEMYRRDTMKTLGVQIAGGVIGATIEQLLPHIPYKLH